MYRPKTGYFHRCFVVKSSQVKISLFSRSHMTCEELQNTKDISSVQDGIQTTKKQLQRTAL